MKGFRIFLAFALLPLVYLFLLNNWYHSFFQTQYWETGDFVTTCFSGGFPLWGGFLVFLLGRLILKSDWGGDGRILLLLSPLFLQSCDHAKSNQIVVVSENCGLDWKQIANGEAIPTGTGNYCFMKEIMPGYDMQGTMEYYVLYKNQVKVKMYLTYNYQIFEPLLFMKAAKQLGTTNSNADQAQVDNQRFEGAENRVIEVHIKKVTSDIFENQDVVSHDINALEFVAQDSINLKLAVRGVRLTNVEMVPDFQPQTQTAIDVSNAITIYKSNGLEELGHEIIKQKAGATQIIINNEQAQTGKEKESN